MKIGPSLLLFIAAGITAAAPLVHATTATATATATGAAAPAQVTVLSARRIHTLDPAQPAAQAMAFDGQGKILALGAAAQLQARFPQARTLDAGDATVIPGLIDAHGHIGNLGLIQMRVDLRNTVSKADILERARAFAATLPPGEWLLGRGWDQNDWPEKEYPTAADLDAAFPDRPVWFRRVDGHAGWANSAALRLSQRDLSGDWQPEGGQVLRDAKGQPTGVFIDQAEELIGALVPALTDAMTERALKLGMQSAIAHGLTGVHDMGVDRARMRVYQGLAARQEIPLRIYALADGDGAALDWLCSDGRYRHEGGRLEMRAVKFYADGALGSRGAALLADYSDDPGNRGLLVTEPEAMRAAVAKARRCGVQAATHAIGDRGNRVMLDHYASALKDAGNHRWRIEHAQVLALDDIPRLARMQVIASVQPTHATSDMPWAETRVGPERIKGAYAWRRLVDSGARLALGSDFPVESVDPRLGLHAAVTRSDAEGKPDGGWRAEEKLSAEEALRGFTLDAAYAGFAENDVGSLAVGKRADFLLLGADPLAAGTSLRTLPIRATYVDGKAVFVAPKP